MNIWYYNPHTKTLIGQGKADQSPLEPGVFLIPAFATNISPPEAPEDCDVVFTGGGWAIEEILLPEPEIPTAPLPFPGITATQLRLALLGLGIDNAQVEAAINAMPGTDMQREAARIQWEYATIFLRQHPLVAAIGAALGMTDAQIDEAWLNAATLQ